MIILILALFIISGCAVSTPCEWYVSTSTGCDVDVFYIVSTNVLDAKDKDGNDTYRAFLSSDDKALFGKEADYVHGKFGSDMSFYSPYYHQFTLSAFSMPDSTYYLLKQDISKEVCLDFDYYMRHYNKGHRFILCGFSQGAMYVLDILKHMSDEQYNRCVAAYVLGYRLSDEDLSSPHIKPATNETDSGVTISFNSVADTSAIWPDMTRGAVTCINPVNWRTDASPGNMSVDDSIVSVTVDTTAHVLVVKGINPADYAVPALDQLCKPGNLHLCDLLLYSDLIGRNASVRAGLLSY